jgi:hypothetical protein
MVGMGEPRPVEICRLCPRPPVFVHPAPLWKKWLKIHDISLYRKAFPGGNTKSDAIGSCRFISRLTGHNTPFRPPLRIEKRGCFHKMTD